MKNFLFLFIISVAFLSSCKKRKLSHNLVSFTIEKPTQKMTLDLEKAKFYLDLSKPVSKREILLWKGSTDGLLTYQDGTTKKFKISNYGGFFYDLEEKIAYQIPEKHIGSWSSFIRKNLPSD